MKTKIKKFIQLLGSIAQELWIIIDEQHQKQNAIYDRLSLISRKDF